MTFVPLVTQRPQVAMALGRRFGNAAERNRGRRRLRSAFAAGWKPELGLSGAFLLSGNRRVLSEPFDRLVAAVESCLVQLSAPTSPGEVQS